MKKCLALILILLLAAVPCLSDEEALPSAYAPYREMAAGHDLSGLKLGFLFPGEDYEYPSQIRMEAIAALCREMGLAESQISVQFGITPETVYASAVSLAQEGCDLIFAEGVETESEFLRAAAEHSSALFFHLGGDMAQESGLDNAYNWNFAEHEARYVAGIVAGVRIQEMLRDKEVKINQPVYVGYVAPQDSPEVRSAATAFYLGAKSVLPNAEVRLTVVYAGENADDAQTYAATLMLMRDYGYQVGAIAAHEFTTGVAVLSDALYVYSVGYGMDLTRFAKKNHLQSVCVDRGIYYAYAVACAASGEAIQPDWCGGFAEGAVFLTPINETAFTWGTRFAEANQAMDQAIEAIVAGELHVFDLSTFTVNGEVLTDSEYIVETDEAAYFAEGEFQSRPAFDYLIDGAEAGDTSF